MKDEAAQMVKVGTGATTTGVLAIANIQAYFGIAVAVVTIIYTSVLIYDKFRKMRWEDRVREKELEVLESQK